MSKWRSFSVRELDELGRAAAPLTDSREQVCPHCGNRSLRRYVYDHRGSRLVSMSYVWCSGCHHYATGTAPPLRPEFEFDDPGDKLARLRELRNSNLPTLLRYLDELWDEGVLPQHFTRT